MHIDDLFRSAVKENASDLHLVVGQPPILRIDGKLQAIDGKKILTANIVKELVFDIITTRQKEVFLQDKELDISYEINNLARFRINIHFEKGNIGMVARVIPKTTMSLKDLMSPSIIYDLVGLKSGLVLVTGPTGCGKTTLLAAMIEYINQNYARHIVTLEDPIEFVFTSKKSLIIQRQLHSDMLTFESALTHVLRQDPNIVVVGEMRNLETISSVVTLAETGHLVFATLHTHTAEQTVDRIIDIFPAHQQDQIRIQLSTTLSGIVSQRLIPSIKKGRIAVREVLTNTPAVGNLIRENKVNQIRTVIQTNAEEGMFTMDQDLIALYKDGHISLETAKNYIVNPSLLK